MSLRPSAALLAALTLLAFRAEALTPRPIQHTVTGDLTLDQAVQLSLKQNPNILKALQQIEQTRGQIIEVRAQALPHVQLLGSYYQQDKSLVQKIPTGSGGSSSSSSTNVADSISKSLSNIPGLTPSTAEQVASAVAAATAQQSQSQSSNSNIGGGDISWNVTVQATQVIYAGGQIAAAIRIAKFTDDSSYFSLRDTVDQTIDTVRQQFYTVLLNRALITVQEESVRLLQDQLKDQQNRFEAGTVPRFNVLQAEVALANQIPQLISAKNAYVVSEYTLAKTLGIDPGPQGQTTYHAVGNLDVRERPISLRDAIEIAIDHRPFLKVQRLNVLVQKENIKVALAGYLPQLNFSGGYKVQNSGLTSHLDDTIDGWFYGFTGQWNIFDGFETFGKVKAARASLESSKVNYDDSVHQVELEVQQAYANLQTARETIRSQEKTVEEALEAVRLATERLAAGAGTQLDVLNAQVQLTTARSTELQARANYNTAMAEFDRVTASDTIYAETFKDPMLNHRAPKDPPIDAPKPAPAKKKVP